MRGTKGKFSIALAVRSVLICVVCFDFSALYTYRGPVLRQAITVVSFSDCFGTLMRRVFRDRIITNRAVEQRTYRDASTRTNRY